MEGGGGESSRWKTSRQPAAAAGSRESSLVGGNKLPVIINPVNSTTWSGIEIVSRQRDGRAADL